MRYKDIIKEAPEAYYEIKGTPVYINPSNRELEKVLQNSPSGTARFAPGYYYDKEKKKGISFIAMWRAEDLTHYDVAKVVPHLNKYGPFIIKDKGKYRVLADKFYPNFAEWMFIFSGNDFKEFVKMTGGKPVETIEDNI